MPLQGEQIAGVGEHVVTGRDLEIRARERLSPEVYAYYAGAAGIGATLAANS